MVVSSETALHTIECFIFLEQMRMEYNGYIEHLQKLIQEIKPKLEPVSL